MVHYSLYYRLYGEELLADAVVELEAEKLAATLCRTFKKIGLLCVLELADLEVCIIHKLLVGRPHRPLALLPSFYRPLLVSLKEVNLLH